MKIEELLIKAMKIAKMSATNPEAASLDYENLVKNFNENYKIVPKEEFGVIYNSGDAGRIVTGGFHSEKEAKRFKDEWYQKQDEYIESILATNPESDVCNNTYLTVGKIEPVKKEYLEWFKFDHEIEAQRNLTELLLSGE